MRKESSYLLDKSFGTRKRKQNILILSFKIIEKPLQSMTTSSSSMFHGPFIYPPAYSMPPFTVSGQAGHIPLIM